MTQDINVRVNVESAAGVGAMAGFAASITSAGIALVQAGISAAMDAVGNSITLASDKAEAASKVNVLFGESADQIARSAEGAATSVGLSGGQYLTAAGNLGNLLANFDLGNQAAADMSQGMIQLAADVGSFNNTDPAAVVEAMGAAMRGESEPMRRFGVLIDEAAIKSKGLELGVDASKTAIDKAGRAQAIYALMLEQTSAAQGDFARTSDGLANSQRIAAARMEDAWARVGERLMPLVQAVLPMLADGIIWIVDGIGELIDAVQEWADQNQDLLDTLSDLGGMIIDYIVWAFGVWMDIIGELGYRIGGLIGVVIDLLGAIVDMGDAVIRALSADFEGAAAAAERGLDRIGSFAENVQRAMGDTGRRMADEALAATSAAERATAQSWTDIEAAQRQNWSALAEGSARGATEVTQSTTAAIRRGTPALDLAARELGERIPEGLEEGRREGVKIAAAVPGDAAAAMRGRRDSWKDALDLLVQDIKNSMDRGKEIAKLEAVLTGRAIQTGLASTDPLVRAQAQHTVGLIEDRLSELGAIGQSGGNALGRNAVAALNAWRTEWNNTLNGMANAARDRLLVKSPAKVGPWSQDGGPIEWMAQLGRRMVGALDAPFRSFRITTPALAFAGGGASSSGSFGGPGVTVNIYSGVGDPVAIGRDVKLALDAYYRASGTE